MVALFGTPPSPLPVGRCKLGNEKKTVKFERKRKEAEIKRNSKPKE
jgi:hypothetical protein